MKCNILMANKMTRNDNMKKRNMKMKPSMKYHVCVMKCPSMKICINVNMKK